MVGKNEILKVINEAKILGKTIQVYGSVNNPLFYSGDVAAWIAERDGYTVCRKVDDEEKLLHTICVGGQNRKVTMLTEDGLYECCMRSRKPIAKQMKKEIKRYLKSIRLTGGTIEKGRESEMVHYYFSQFSDETKLVMVRELEEKNNQLQNKIQELEKDWKTLTDCKGSMDINQIAHFVGIGEYKLFDYLRKMKILFKNSNGDNVPYENPNFKDKFYVIATTSPDGKLHSQTRVYPTGLEYILRRLRKEGYIKYEVA